MIGILLFIVLIINVYNVVNTFSLCNNRKISNYRTNSYNNFGNSNSVRKSNSVLKVSILNSGTDVLKTTISNNYNPFIKAKDYFKYEKSEVVPASKANIKDTDRDTVVSNSVPKFTKLNYSPFKKQYPQIENSIATNAAASSVIATIQTGASIAKKSYSPFKKQYPKIENFVVVTSAAAIDLSVDATAIQTDATVARKNYSPFKKQYPKIESTVGTSVAKKNFNPFKKPQEYMKAEAVVYSNSADSSIEIIDNNDNVRVETNFFDKVYIEVSENIEHVSNFLKNLFNM